MVRLHRAAKITGAGQQASGDGRILISQAAVAVYSTVLEEEETENDV